jgi:1,4-alpha-glucan branching enzyme
MRKGKDERARCLVVVNFTPQLHREYRIPVPFGDAWREILNSDAAVYGGSNAGNAGLVTATQEAAGHELRLVVPPLATIYLVPER